MIRYSYQKDPAGNFYPIIPISVIHKEITLKLDALIDSGATISIFKPEIAISLNTPIRMGKSVYLGGVGGRIKGYLHKFTVEIANKSFSVPVVFSYEYTISINLSGRQAIFKNFQIIFDEKNLRVTLK